MERTSGSCSLSLGEKAPYFSLPATDGKIYSISDFSKSKGMLIIFTCNHCPYARAYESRICKIAETYKDQGIETVAICSNDGEDYPEDSFEQMINKSRQLGFPFPYLHDDKQQVAKAYDAACTPEAYLFDEHQKLFYHGWIDDNHGNPEQVKSHDLENAIKALLSNSPPPKAETPVLGCSIKWNIG